MYRNAIRTGGAVGLLAASISSALAQQAPAQAAQLEEIVVTARKQAESVQETPLSVTAFTADRIDDLGLTGVADIALRTPGLNYGNFGDLKLSPTSLRGVVASSGSAGQDPAVGLYVDEVFLGQGVAASMDLYDIERVEVLRGPQGTLYGRNTIGGVISMTTKRPSSTPEASAELQYGNYDQVRVAGSISGPLVADKVSAKLSAVYDDRDGTSDNVWLNIPVNDKHHWTARGQLLFTPSDTTELMLTGEYFKVDQHPLVFETVMYDEEALLPFLLDAYGLPRNTDTYDRKVYSNQETTETLELWGVSAALRMRAGPGEFVSITSYRTHDYFSRDDTERSPIDFAYDGDPEEVDTFSQEFRYAWTSGNTDWLLGAYYFDHESSNFSFIEYGPDLVALFELPDSFIGQRSGSDATLKTTSVAGFGSVTIRTSDQLDFTLGGRYTHEKKDIDYVQTDPLFFLGGNFAVQADDTWSEFTPSASARYRFTPDVMGYATISKGYKSGGYNDALGDANGISYDPEMLWNYELGVKSEFADRRVMLNVAVYYMDWSDIQMSQDNPATPLYDPTILNAGKAHSVGIETELEALVTDQFRVSANLSYQEAQYDEGTLPQGGGADPLPLKGNWIPYAPQFTGGLVADYRVPAGSGLMIFTAEALLRGETYLNNDNQADGNVGSYGLYNARVGYEAESGKWSVMLWGKNLSDKAVKLRLFDLSGQTIIAQKFTSLNDPRTYGVTLRVNF